ncbi:hypothetical protein [Amycolatopsis sp. SID8362]|uniref:hypothetical protein n=1 Tax=Amycolatopsis sp. SID8362 TaxID=2690346 RepID=UPI0019405D89|nr:hypothetical protein [Amycolatopsis sp. SID8362]
MVAVVLFLVLNSANGGSGGDQTAQSPGTQPTTGHTTPKSGESSATNAPAGLGKTVPESKITDFGAAGRALTAFYDNPAGGWSKLTPAAQQVYGSEQAFADYWANNKVTDYASARADSGGSNSDGSITMNLTVNGTRNGYRIVMSGGQMLIDADTRLGPQGAAGSGY